jgi:hypothetical protein
MIIWPFQEANAGVITEDLEKLIKKVEGHRSGGGWMRRLTRRRFCTT